MPRRAFLAAGLLGVLWPGLVGGAEEAKPALGATDGADPALPGVLRRFVAEKERQAGRSAKALGSEVSPEVTDYFKAALAGDWQGAMGRYAEARGSIAMPDAEAEPDNFAAAAVQRAVLLEVQLALEQVMDGNPSLALKLGEQLMACVPAGAIYFGGTDPGRGLPTALSTSHERGDPFFTLTQNALADTLYLAYLRRIYGGKIAVPTREDSDLAFKDYLSDLQRRMDHDRAHPEEPRQIKPGENVSQTEGRLQVSGQVAVMAINARLARTIFDRNDGREFYVEESFPLDWMYPHLAPAGLILKVERKPRAEISAAEVEKDYAYWAKVLRPVFGDWLKAEVTMSNVCAFVRKVHVEHNLKGFAGDPAYLQLEGIRKIYAKLRAAIGGVYAWRHGESKEGAFRQRMARAAESAFLQSFAVCPTNPEAIFRLVNLLVVEQRINDALQLVNLAAELDPAQANLESLAAELRRMQAGAGHQRSPKGEQ